MRVVAIVVSAVALVLAGAALAASSSRVPVRSCASRAEAPERGVMVYRARARDLVLGRAVVLGAAESLSVPKPRPGEDSFVKRGVAIRTGGAVTIRITPLGRARVALAYVEPGSGIRRAADGQHAVRFESCPPDTTRFSDGRPLGRWTVYPGGFIVARKGCVRLTATAAGENRASGVVAIGVPVARCR